MAGFLSSLFSERPGVRHYVAIDLGSHSAIRSIIFNTDGQGRDPRVMRKRNFELPIRPETQTMIPLIGAELRRLIFEYIKEIGRVPEGILIGLGSQFIANSRERLTFERQDPRRSISAQELKAMLNGHLSQAKPVRVGAETYHRFFSLPFRIEVDGYHLETLSSESRGNTVTIHLFTTYAALPFMTELTHLGRILGGLTISFISNIAAIAGGVVNILNLEEALVVKIGARRSEVVLIRSGTISAAGEFPSGGDALTQSLSRSLGIPFAEAEGLKRELGTARLERQIQAKADSALRQAAKHWLGELSAFLVRDEVLVLPETLFLVGGGARLPAVKEVLSTEPWFEDFTFLPRLNIIRLDAADLARAIFPTASAVPLSGPEEVALVSLAAHLIQKPATLSLSGHELF